jgi:type I site-specific restriction endonuclease
VRHAGQAELQKDIDQAHHHLQTEDTEYLGLRPYQLRAISAVEAALQEVVVDGFLVDHEPPLRIITKLAEDGITWLAGEQVQTYVPDTGQLNLIQLPDEVNARSVWGRQRFPAWWSCRLVGPRCDAPSVRDPHVPDRCPDSGIS